MKILFSHILKILTCAMLVFLPPAIHAAEPVAMITDVSGNVYFEDKGKSAPLAVLTYLVPGQKIVLEQGARMVVTYFSPANEYSVKGAALVAVKEQELGVLKGHSEARKLNAATSDTALNYMRSGKLVMAAMEMRGLVMLKPILLYPENTRIAIQLPVFRWRAMDDAEKYLLTLMTGEGQELRRAEVVDTSWPLPGDMPLQHGAAYRWKVEAVLKSGERRSAEARFSVADKESVEKINAMSPAAEASFADKVRYAVTLEAEGFRADAKGMWRELSREHPDDPNLKRYAR